MAMICLVVEGIYDQIVYPVLAKRCRVGVRTITRQCRGPVISKLPGVLDYLDQTQSGIERALVVFDSDGRNPEELQREVRRKLVRKYGFEVTPIIVVEALEAWLIADPVALKDHIGNSRNFTNPEGLRHPKSELTKLLPHRKRYTPEIARRLAESLDLNLLEQRCPRFAVFRNAVIRH